MAEVGAEPGVESKYIRGGSGREGSEEGRGLYLRSGARAGNFSKVMRREPGVLQGEGGREWSRGRGSGW
jgi:hypothetical protein